MAHNPIIELPALQPGDTLADLHGDINARLRAIDDALRGAAFRNDGVLDMHGKRIVNLGKPRNRLDAAHKEYVDRRIAASGSASAAALDAAEVGDAGAQFLSLSRNGTLAILSDVAPRVSLPADRQVAEIVAHLKTASSGDVVVEVQTKAAGSAAVVYTTITIPTGQTLVNVGASSLGSISANHLILLNVTAVGLSFPGSDLSVLFRLAPEVVTG